MLQVPLDHPSLQWTTKLPRLKPVERRRQRRLLGLGAGLLALTLGGAAAGQGAAASGRDAAKHPAALDVPAPAPTPAAAPDSRPVVVRVMTEAQGGEIEVVTEVGGTVRDHRIVRFDYGDKSAVTRLHSAPRAVDGGGIGAQSLREELVIGAASWQRDRAGSWATAPNWRGAREQLDALLPDADALATATCTPFGPDLMLWWHDEGRDADVTLFFDPAIQMPRLFVQQFRATGEVRKVYFHGWNMAVDLPRPAAP